MRYSFHPEAETEFFNAIEYYEEREEGLGYDFAVEVYSTIERILAHPLVTLVEAYEEQHHPIPPPDPIETILHHMESQGLSHRDLEPYLGSPTRVSEILNRKRPLSLDMIRKLQSGLGISAEVLIRSYELQTAS